MNLNPFKTMSMLTVFVLSSTSVNAKLIYNFSTELILLSGSDISGLGGANIAFTATVTDGASYLPSIISAPSVPATDSEWTIAGSNIDGVYTSINPVWHASYNGNRAAGWQSGGSHFVGVADLSLVAIFHKPVTPQIFVGNLVQPSDWGELSTATNYWRASDSSLYDWNDNATFSVTQVPVPPAVYLFSTALLGIGRLGLRKHKTRRSK